MQKKRSGRVRIIAGKWRGKKLNFIASSTIRPTPDRVRETLFNWLGEKVIEANCLDCFAGSGALSFEALSRGAKSVWMFDISRLCIENLKKNTNLLGALNVNIRLSKFPPLNKEQIFLPFDIVFLDPPYRRNLIEISSFWLKEHKWVKQEGLVYVEAEKELWPLPIPRDWQVLKRGIAGQIGYYLVLAL